MPLTSLERSCCSSSTLAPGEGLHGDTSTDEGTPLGAEKKKLSDVRLVE